uniref:Uncharacterized protein n=1 Tax=Romanomermis culicivorax TaxID=13658 RepID=A0A915IF51_ROMCU
MVLELSIERIREYTINNKKAQVKFGDVILICEGLEYSPLSTYSRTYLDEKLQLPPRTVTEFTVPLPKTYLHIDHIEFIPKAKQNSKTPDMPDAAQ